MLRVQPEQLTSGTRALGDDVIAHGPVVMDRARHEVTSHGRSAR